MLYQLSYDGDGGADRDRTDDIQLAKLALSQLSYGPSNYLVPPSRLERVHRKAAEPKSAASTNSAKEAGINLLALYRLSSWGGTLLGWGGSSLLWLFLLRFLGFLRTFAHGRVSFKRERCGTAAALATSADGNLGGTTVAVPRGDNSSERPAGYRDLMPLAIWL